jgi:hypothetical protein
MPLRKKGLDSQGLGSRRRDGSRVGKRATLKEDSSLGSKGIDILEVDLSWLIGGKSFIILYTLSCNRYRVNTTTLANSRANTFALLDTIYTKKISKFLNTPFKQLERSIPIKGYNRQMGKPIISIL